MFSKQKKIAQSKIELSPLYQILY